MSLNGGLGDIVAGQKGILLDSMLTEKMTAVCGDRCNVWLLTRAAGIYVKAYEISESGINTTPVLSACSQNAFLGAPGTMAVAPGRRRVAISAITPDNNLFVFDFDPLTGQLSNELPLSPTSLGVYGLCFSPDNSKLYGSTNLGPGSFLFQYDLNAGTPAAIAAALTHYPFNFFSQLKTGPDGKVYYASNGTTIGRFASPNLTGVAAQHQPAFLTLADSTNATGGLPNPVPVIIKDTVLTIIQLKMPCFADITTLQASNLSGWDYQWSNGITGPVLTTNVPGQYWISYRTAPCAWHTDTFRLQATYTLPALLTDAGCRDQTNGRIRALSTAGDTAIYTYLWRNAAGDTLRGPVPTGHGDTLSQITGGAVYTLRITTADGCDTTLTIPVPLPLYDALFSVSDSVICMGDSVSFTNISGPAFDSWQWTFGDGWSTGPGIENPHHTYPQPGRYTVRLMARTPYPCFDTAYRDIEVDSLFTGNFLKDRDSICTGETIYFNPYTDSSAMSLEWHFGDGNGFMAAVSATQHAYDREGVYPVQLSTRFRACPATAYTDSIYVYPLPLVDLGPDTGLCLNGAPIFLQNLQPPPEGIYHCFWSNGDTASRIKLVHPGTYSLTISAGPLGCSTTETMNVHKDCYIDIPNAFTPNNDGVNDYFFSRQLLSRKVTRFKMQLFNRWGQIVFETTAVNGRGWDGKFNNSPQPEGVYIYLIDVEIDGVHPEHYQGNLTLLR
ncbi:PKD domain-containing protein [Taibaiella koreensis]|uniref:PKD domain-containing protein n=1 Tax=Taibaiella koreensis TaxID=1268548 RepID=UPI000E59D619|nr:PKD domain-containing protein [Taibaiella koreensis]